MKNCVLAILIYFVIALISVNAFPVVSVHTALAPSLIETLISNTAGDKVNVSAGEETAGLQDVQSYVDKDNFVGIGILVGVNLFTDSGINDMYSPLNVYLGASLTARHKNFVFEAAYEPVAKNRVGHPGEAALPREGPESRAWTELDVALFSGSLLYTIPVSSRVLKPYFGGGIASYSIYERLTAQDDRGNQYYEEVDTRLTGFQLQTGIRFFQKNFENKLELKYGSAKGKLVFDEFNYGGLTLQFAAHYGFDF